MNYTVLILPRADRELESLPAEIAERIDAAIQALAANPRPPGCKKLRNEDRYRIRVGNYRVLYTIDDRQKMIVVAAVGHRREIYR